MFDIIKDWAPIIISGLSLIETYNQKVDFIDYDALNQIIKVINQ